MLRAVNADLDRLYEDEVARRRSDSCRAQSECGSGIIAPRYCQWRLLRDQKHELSSDSSPALFFCLLYADQEDRSDHRLGEDGSLTAVRHSSQDDLKNKTCAVYVTSRMPAISRCIV